MSACKGDVARVGEGETLRLVAVCFGCGWRCEDTFPPDFGGLLSARAAADAHAAGAVVVAQLAAGIQALPGVARAFTAALAGRRRP